MRGITRNHQSVSAIARLPYLNTSLINNVLENDTLRQFKPKAGHLILMPLFQ